MTYKKYFIGIDLGGTNIRAAGVSPEGEILARKKVPSLAGEGYEAVLARIVSSVESVIKKVGAEPESIGLAAPGAINFDKGIITQSPDFTGLANASISSDLEKELNIRVTLENDANSAALGEGWVGAAKEWSDYMMLTLGTGVGGGFVLNNKIWHGPTGMGGEIGHLMVEPGGRLCGCGNYGCLETYASASGVAQSAKEWFGMSGAQWLREAACGVEDSIDAEIVAKGAAQGDKLCIEVLEDAGMYLGRAIAQVALLLDITKYIFAGGMSPCIPLMEDAIRKEAIKSAYTLKDKAFYIRSATLADDAGVLGAALVAMKADRENG